MTQIEPILKRLASPSSGGVRAVALDVRDWEGLYEAIRRGVVAFVSLWAEGRRVFVAVRAKDEPHLAVFSLNCPTHVYPALAPIFPPASRLERALRDTSELVPEAMYDPRSWLDHGVWPDSPPAAQTPYAFLPVEGDGLHQVPVGPVHAGVIEPGHFLFTANGEAVVRLEARLGYTHKGTLGLMAGASLAHAARLAGRVSGDSTVAYALAFALAVERAAGVEPPPRAKALRGLLAELERMANHLGDIGAVCQDAAFALLSTPYAVLRERVLQACAEAFGHRLMMDVIQPGGVARDLEPDGEAVIRKLIKALRRDLPRLQEVYDETNSLQDRTVGIGRVPLAWVERFGAGGYVGRASGRAFDARLWASYAPYDALHVDTSVEADGDVNARVWQRLKEVSQSLDLVDQILALSTEGLITVDLGLSAWAETEGTALVEGFRGDIFAWVRLKGQSVVACHLRDPSWFQWPLLETAIEGAIIADFPLINKSFNCSYSGVDL